MPELDVTDQKSRTARAGAGRDRTCIVTRETGSPDGLIRFALGPGGVVVPDIKAKLPGRGAWVTAERRYVETASNNGAFSRAFRAKVAPTDRLADLVSERLHEAALQRLAIANKAGQVITGAEKIRAALETNQMLAIIHASDASDEGVRKLEQKFQHVAADREIFRALATTSRHVFTTSEMSLALGGPNVVHAGVIEGGASRAFLQELIRLIRYETGESAIHLEITA